MKPRPIVWERRPSSVHKPGRLHGSTSGEIDSFLRPPARLRRKSVSS